MNANLVTSENLKTGKKEAEITDLTLDTQEEIDKIMNEIEELQKSMDTTPAATPPSSPASPELLSEPEIEAPSPPLPATISLKTGENESLDMFETLASSPPPLPTTPPTIPTPSPIIDAAPAPILSTHVDHTDPLIPLPSNSPSDPLFDQPSSEFPAHEESKEESKTEKVKLYSVNPSSSFDDTDRPTQLDSHPRQKKIHPQKDDLSALSMTLQGDMRVKLSYESLEECVIITFKEQTLHIQFSNGTEMTVPMEACQSQSIRLASSN